jgi:hypothetical protein
MKRSHATVRRANVVALSSVGRSRFAIGDASGVPREPIRDEEAPGYVSTPIRRPVGIAVAESVGRRVRTARFHRNEKRTAAKRILLHPSPPINHFSP